MRTGVPVFIRPTIIPSSFNCSDIPYDAGSEILPPGSCVLPICIRPFINVPDVMTTDRAVKVTPMLVITPVIVCSFMISLFTVSCQMERCSVFSIILRQVSINLARSFCARGLHIAGPFERFSIRNCIAVWSVTIPVNPPKASISLTICPFAIPPIAGLQLIWAILFISIVMRSVSEPRFAAAHAASQPACPAPTTITS